MGQNTLYSAEEIRSIQKQSETKIHELMHKIRMAAVNGLDVLHVCDHYCQRDLDKLRELGFKVEIASSMAIQKDGLYFTVRW